MTTHRLASAASALAVLVLLLAAPTTARAHDEIVGTTPANGARVDTLPAEVVIEFSAPPQSGTAHVFGPDGSGDLAGQVTVRDAALVIPLRQDDRPGRYEVEFTVVSDDGHSTSESFGFRVLPDPPQEPAPSPAGEDSTQDDSTRRAAPATSQAARAQDGSPVPWFAATGGIVLALASLGILWWARRRSL